ncbi:thiaminase II [Suttonella sp. R2A3]|uniref:thiaminase II n=1 Tax=Suttonella sp. R2A3 TaxID=2908648 RepID=UPI001F3D20F2|nr:thiaminase II [Suttonella sp. R2A3]UJF25286.1 thiaminase II [Suttonella sp. R2A3]
MNTYQQLSHTCPNYREYIEHGFVRQLGDGSLPAAAFRMYLQQDFLFLIHFTRAWGLAIYKSATLPHMRAAQAGINAMLDTEIGLHIEYCQQWGISEQSLYTLDEHPATVAYTRYVLDSGMNGSLAELHIALAPCMLGYAEIGRWLSEQPWTEYKDNPYQPWIALYASEEFQRAAQAESDLLDELCAEFTPAQLKRAQHIFNTATNMEIAFWQMGLDHTD